MYLVFFVDECFCTNFHQKLSGPLMVTIHATRNVWSGHDVRLYTFPATFMVTEATFYFNMISFIVIFTAHGALHS